MDGIHFQSHNPAAYQTAIASHPRPAKDLPPERDSATKSAGSASKQTSSPVPVSAAVAVNHRVEMSYHEELHQVVVKVIDRDTDKVIEEFPAEEIQKVRLHIRQALGSIVDEEA